MDIIQAHLNRIKEEIKTFDRPSASNSIWMLDFINQQQETIELLKCCGNCNETHTGKIPKCKGCKDFSNWQPIN